MKLELCKTGKYNDVVINENHLKEMTETFQGRVPVVIGHQRADHMPAFGWITGVELKDNKLLGDVELTELMRDAWDKGYYRNWSISARKDKETGKYRLRHLAMLGDVLPAIKDLQVVSLSDDGDEKDEITFENHFEEDKTMDQEKDKKVDQKSPREQSIELSEFNLLKEKLASLEAENQRMKKQYREAKLSTLKSAIEGKIPKDKVALVISLAEQMDQEQEITLSENEKKSAIDVLTEIFASIALPVTPGELDLGDADDKNDEKIEWKMGGKK